MSYFFYNGILLPLFDNLRTAPQDYDQADYSRNNP